MHVKLKVVHGRLKDRAGGDAGLTVDIRSSTFVIGSGEETNMRCPSKTISARHCELKVEQSQVTIRDLASETGTFVNDERLEGARILQHQDHLRVGRLEFEVEFVRSPLDNVPAANDPVGEYVSDLLVEGDEQERARRLEDPEARQFHIEPAEPKAEDELPAEDGPKKLKRPPKKPPGKLPPPPPFTAENTVEAAEETLKKIFERQKR